MVANEMKQVLRDFLKSLKITIVQPWENATGSSYLIISDESGELLRIPLFVDVGK